MVEETAVQDTNEPVTDENTSNELSVDELVSKKVEEQLSKIKGNLDSAYGQRDNALKELETLKKEKQEAEIKALEEQGKATEALEARMKLMQEEMKSLQETNTKLTRDTEVKTLLAGLDFTHEKAAKMASLEIVSSLKKAENGSWVGPNGESLHDYVNSYASDENNSFLFKAKVNSGASSVTATGKSPTSVSQNKSIKEMSVEEALAAAAAGKLDGDRRWY